MCSRGWERAAAGVTRIATLFALLASPGAEAYRYFNGLFPNADRVACPPGQACGGLSVCEPFGHVGCGTSDDQLTWFVVSGGGAKSKAAEKEAENPSWTVAVCRADADGDGRTSGDEMGDPCCVWRADGGAPPARTTDVSHPGDRGSVTSAASCSLQPPPALTALAWAREASGGAIVFSWSAPPASLGCVCRYELMLPDGTAVAVAPSASAYRLCANVPPNASAVRLRAVNLQGSGGEAPCVA